MTDHFESTSPIERVQYHTHDGVNSPLIDSVKKHASGTETRLSTAGTGTQEITCGFRPSFLRITVIQDGTHGSVYTGTCNIVGNTFENQSIGFHWGDTSTFSPGMSTVEFAYANAVSGGGVSTGRVSAVSNTSFTINWQAMQVDVKFIWEAYK